jgi:molybdopterin converting factor small subunit
LQVHIQVDNSSVVPLREVVGASSLIMDVPEGSTINDLLLRLDKTFGPAFKKVTGKKLYDRVIVRYRVFLNNRGLWLPKQLRSELKDGDAVIILLPSGGG